jgi:hypothetical protein
MEVLNKGIEISLTHLVVCDWNETSHTNHAFNVLCATKKIIFIEPKDLAKDCRNQDMSKPLTLPLLLCSNINAL